MKYEIEKVGAPGKLYLEAYDIMSAARAKDSTHAVELAVRYRKPYLADSSFEWQGAGSKELKLRMVVDALSVDPCRHTYRCVGT
jgi:hypothetical protein